MTVDMIELTLMQNMLFVYSGTSIIRTSFIRPHARLSELIFGAFIRLIRYSVFNYSMNIIIGRL